MSEHTPGPWGVRKGFSEPKEIYPLSKGRPPFGEWSEIAAIHDYGKETVANARLIGAAPDLLGALEAILVQHHGGGHVTEQHYAAARKAVAKARGRKNT